ncbi:MAG: hypothetical protein EPO07_20375, partial [Verrucomicrobia bacterium]
MSNQHTILSFLAAGLLAATGCGSFKHVVGPGNGGAVIQLKSAHLVAGEGVNGSLKLDGLFYETSRERIVLPAKLNLQSNGTTKQAQTTMPDGRVVTVSLEPRGKDFILKLSAQPSADIV